jgi:hypothetical protein
VLCVADILVLRMRIMKYHLEVKPQLGYEIYSICRQKYFNDTKLANLIDFSKDVDSLMMSIALTIMRYLFALQATETLFRNNDLQA